MRQLMNTAWLKPARIWTLRVLKIVVTAFLLLLAFQVLVLPSIIRYVVRNAFDNLGLNDVSFDVSAASFFRTQLINIRLGTEELNEIGHIGVDFSPATLLHGHVKTIWVGGAEVRISVQNGQVNLGPLALKRGTGPAKPFPFDRLQLRASTLEILWEDRRLWVPMQGTLTAQSSGPNYVDAQLRIQGSPVHLAGSFDFTTNQIDFTATAGALDAPALATAIPQVYAGYAPSISTGTIGLNATYVRSGQSAKLTASTIGRSLRFGSSFADHRLWVQDLDWTANLAFDGSFDLLDASASATAKRISVDSEPATNIVLSATKQNQQLAINVSAAGQDWQLRQLKGTIAGLFGPSANKQYQLDTALALDGRIPRQLARTLLNQRLNVYAAGEISLRGQVSATATHNSDGTFAWHARTDQMQAGLTPGNLSINKDALLLRGLGAVFRFSGQAGNAGATIRLMPGSNMWTDSIEQRLVPLDHQKLAANVPFAALAINDDPAELTLHFDGSNPPWAIHIPAASLTIPQLNVSGPKVKLENLDTAIHFSGDLAPGSIEVFAREGSAASFKSLQASLGSEPLWATGWKLNLASKSGEPLLRISTAETGGMPVVFLHAQSQNPLVMKNSSMESSIGNFALDANLGFDIDHNPALDATLSLVDASANYKPAAARVSGLSATIPITWNTSPSQPAKLNIATIQLRDNVFPAAQGQLAISDNRATFQMNWPVIKDLARISAQGFAEFSQGQPRGQITAEIPAFTIKDESLLAGLIKQLEALKISGTLGAKASLAFQGSALQPLVSVTLKDVNIASKDSPRFVQGLSGTVSFTSFSPLATPGGQRLTIKQANTGKLSFADGSLNFRVEKSNEFQVESTDWAFAGGRIFVNSFRLNLAQPHIDSAITADKLSLADLLDIFAKDKASGQGTLYGHLPFTVNWPKSANAPLDWSRFQLDFGEGFVYATPGGGQLHIDAPDYVQTIAGQVVQSAAAQDTRLSQPTMMENFRNQVINSLKNLDYSTLTLDLLRQTNGSLVAKIVISGKGHGPDGIPFGGINVNVGDFNQILNDAIGIGKILSLGK